MKKIVRLTESELKNIVEASVKRAINEGAVDEGFRKDVAKAVGTGVLGAGLGVAGVGTGLFDDQMDAIDNNSRAFPEDKAEFGDRLKPANSIPSQAELPADTISWKKANHMESRIRRAVMESIMNLMNEGKPADTQIGRHKFKAIRRDKNGNPIYTHEGGTLSDDDLKAQGWKYSKKHGLHGQISDPTKLPK